jgi:hypothetical protein
MVSYKEINFEAIVHDKSIAVVGNSNSLFSQEFGSEIDSHDFVIRFNKPATFYCDFDVSVTHGLKTDVWAFWSIGAFIQRTLNKLDESNLHKEFYENNTIYKIQACDNGHKKELTEYCDFTFSKEKFNRLNKKLISSSVYLSLDEKRHQSYLVRNTRNVLKKLEPSVGISVLEWLTYCRPKKVNVYGMDFKKTPTFSEISRYDEDMKGRVDMRCMHNFALEEVYAKKRIFTRDNYTLRG